MNKEEFRKADAELKAIVKNLQRALPAPNYCFTPQELYKRIKKQIQNELNKINEIDFNIIITNLDHNGYIKLQPDGTLRFYLYKKDRLNNIKTNKGILEKTFQNLSKQLDMVNISIQKYNEQEKLISEFESDLYLD